MCRDTVNCYWHAPKTSELLAENEKRLVDYNPRAAVRPLVISKSMCRYVVRSLQSAICIPVTTTSTIVSTIFMYTVCRPKCDAAYYMHSTHITCTAPISECGSWNETLPPTPSFLVLGTPLIDARRTRMQPNRSRSAHSVLSAAQVRRTSPLIYAQLFLRKHARGTNDETRANPSADYHTFSTPSPSRSL